MNENNQKQASAKEKKKDMYSAVLISQIISIILIMLTFSLSVKGDETAYSSLKELLSQEKFSMGDIVSAVKEYFGSNTYWAVSGDNVTYVSGDMSTTASTDKTDNEVADTTLNGAGGEDITLYEAADNTSFSPIKSTSPALSPIETGRYTSYFGYRISPVTGEFSFHTGLDIAAEEGTKIKAVFNGRVIKTGEDDRAGKYIFLQHDDGLVTFYCHCSEITAEAGAVIRQGETIAKVGSTGWSTGPHLHFEVRKNNIRYNPLYILNDDPDC